MFVCLTILNVNRFFKVPSCTGNLCNATICDSNPCKNGATCLENIGNFSCVCKPGLTGRLCELYLNRCESTPCQNGGTCSNGVDAFTCTCAQGFTGETCDKRTGDCTDPPSIANGRVSLRNSYGIYTCNSGYKIIGFRLIRCDNGRWKGNPPTCQSGESGEAFKIITVHMFDCIYENRFSTLRKIAHTHSDSTTPKGLKITPSDKKRE